MLSDRKGSSNRQEQRYEPHLHARRKTGGKQACVCVCVRCLDDLAFVRQCNAQCTKNLINSEAALVSKVVAEFWFSQWVRTRCTVTGFIHRLHLCSEQQVHISFLVSVTLAFMRFALQASFNQQMGEEGKNVSALFFKKHFYLASYLKCPHRNNRQTVVGTINAREVNCALLRHSLSSTENRKSLVLFLVLSGNTNVQTAWKNVTGGSKPQPTPHPKRANKNPHISPQLLYLVFICNDLQAFKHNVIFLTVGEASQDFVVGCERWW